ncbi:transcriptional regulator, TetR family [Chitinophaga sp. CF118]|uniref:TetR/AcrR family transcriptional regulator n=1 Tax=Chitinophaga sp. CF118 TaxID=1884367 RepID=UPI0008E5C3CD|nr:TetR/AcrR family transcriptional regulator [Chitinophaga sp. CF118]SFD48929.1 transcriptional regulator, TetR family [Chitinophaga sp. CF118]
MRVLNEAKKETVRDTALQMIVEEGFKGLSMQKLAKAADISPATIYIYYKDREDLLNQLYLYVYNTSNHSALENFSADMPFSEGMKVLWLNRFNYFTAHPYHSFFLEQFINSPLITAAVQLEDNTYRTQMKAFYSNAVKKGEVKKLDIEIYWSIAFSPLYQLIKFHNQKGPHPQKPKGITRNKVLQCLEMVLTALKP